ncbi:MAG TPA: type II toxin-antitoxin system VapC family toxin [Methanothrix sp.]|nr:type II toxin-antitoxin system VapC family toxin [Methanothrix sp.]
MPPRAVLDSSVLAAMFFKEAASPRALKCASECDPVTLDLAMAEVGNVAWKQVVFFGENRDRASDALQDCQDFIATACTIIKASDLSMKAFQIAVDDKISYYDSLFLAAAEREGFPLMTLDQKLQEKAKAKRDVRLI